MKKRLALFTIIVSFMILSLFNLVSVKAIISYDDNFGAYIVASGPIEGGSGMTLYYTEIGDGNGILTFDLLKSNDAGEFGIVCGDKSSIGILSNMKDYALFGEEYKSTLEIKNTDFTFVAGYTYQVIFSAKDKIIKLSSKKIGSDDYSLIFEAQSTYEKSNYLGFVALSNNAKSSSVIIDNLSITDLKGREYVSNSFDDGAKITEGNMKTLYVNPITGDKLSAGVGNVFIHKDLLFTVRFMAENGDIISEQKVCSYGSAQAPEAPFKEGYVFDKWSEDTNSITENTVIYPIYKLEEKEPEDDPKGNETVTKDEGTGTTSVINSDDSKNSKGCKNAISGTILSLFSLLIMPIIAIKRRNE